MQRKRRFGSSSNRSYSYQPYKKKNYGKILVRQILICIVIVIAVIVIKKMDNAITQSALAAFKLQVERDYSQYSLVDSAKGAFSYVAGLPGKISGAIEESERQLAFVPPTDGTAVLATFGAKTSYFETEMSGFERGMKFDATEELQVFSVAGGTVEEISTSSIYGEYIKVNHGDNTYSIYGGCTSIYVKPLEKVKKGQLIASVAADEDNYLTFELWIDNEVVNPLEYIVF